MCVCVWRPPSITYLFYIKNAHKNYINKVRPGTQKQADMKTTSFEFVSGPIGRRDVDH